MSGDGLDLFNDTENLMDAMDGSTQGDIFLLILCSYNIIMP